VVISAVPSPTTNLPVHLWSPHLVSRRPLLISVILTSVRTDFWWEGKPAAIISFRGDGLLALKVTRPGETLEGGELLTASTTLISPATTTTVSVNGNLSLKADFIATATARIGYAVGFLGQGLIYGKGGAAWVGDRDDFDGQIATTVSSLPTVLTPLNFSATETRVGWTVGVGVEWAVLRYWSVKGEYDFLDFGRHSVTFTDPVLGGASINVRQQISEVKFGINYRFGPGLVPMY
jgi:hypothetical protein